MKDKPLSSMHLKHYNISSQNQLSKLKHKIQKLSKVLKYFSVQGKKT